MKITNTKNISLIILSIFFLANNIVNATKIEILDCSSGKESWICYSNEVCICRISGTCTDGVLMVYKNNIRDSFCFPSIERGVSAIYLHECENPRGEIKVKASCLEGTSVEKTISIEDKIERITTTTIQKQDTTTIKECSKLGDSCAHQSCCGDLFCCEDMICKESCKEEESETNWWILIIPIIGIIIIVASFLIIKKRGEID